LGELSEVSGHEWVKQMRLTPYPRDTGGSDPADIKDMNCGEPERFSEQLNETPVVGAFATLSFNFGGAACDFL
jgi:hypothetical protein